MIASTKRFIWFFGFWLLSELSMWTTYLIWGNVDTYYEGAWLVLVFWIVPLFIFEDDKLQKGAKQK